ncbi:MAG: MerR family transcriptional regulator [Lachnospiraceae bacterium]|nr:MerR family transcriptional regulator [Lachnospiraceae bacterium]
MKIGEFSRLHHVSIDTVRFYVNEGLLVPIKDGYHYQFDQQCSTDFLNIMLLKEVGFSLQEIKFLILSEQISKYALSEQIDKYWGIFSKKHEEITASIDRLNRARNFIEEKLESFSSRPPARQTAMGISLSLLPLLACPHCQSHLLLQSNRIDMGMVITGEFTCPDCGYSLQVKDGILIADSTEEILNSYSSYDNFITEADPNLMLSILQNVKWMKPYLYQSPCKMKVILELGSGFGFFLRGTYEMIPDDALYIAVDCDIRRHLFLQKALQNCSCRKNIILICCNFENIPIKKNSVDQLIDFGATTDLAWCKKAFALELADAYTHPGTSCIFANRVYEKFHARSPVPPMLRQNLEEAAILSNITRLGYHIIKKERLDFLNQLQPSNQFMNMEDQVYRLMLYLQKEE